MKKRILIVDDHSANLYLLETMLKGYGYEVTAAENGRDALEKALLAPPDLIVSDIMLPVMDGYTLCRRWKSDDALKHIPFVLYSATYTEAGDEELALSLRADRFILKPQEPVILMDILKGVLATGYTARQVATKPLGEEMEFFRRHFHRPRRYRPQAGEGFAASLDLTTGSHPGRRSGNHYGGGQQQGLHLGECGGC